MDLNKTQVNEVQEMEPMVLNDLSKIEDGLIALDNQISLGESGRPDILAVDADGSLVVIELKSVPAGTDALEQSLPFYEWFSENIPLLARPFPQINPQNYVRVLLIAPEFNDGLIRVAKYLDIEIVLILSIPLKDKETGNIGIYYEYIDLERADESTVELR